MRKLFTHATSLADYASAKSTSYPVEPGYVSFVSEAGNESIITDNCRFRTVPSGGTDGLVLTKLDNKLVWADRNDTMLDLLSYGVEWDSNIPDPTLTRIGNMEYHRTLPIQSGMKGCIYNAITKKVVYWLDEHNWNFKRGSLHINNIQCLLDITISPEYATELEISGNIADESDAQGLLVKLIIKGLKLPLNSGSQNVGIFLIINNEYIFQIEAIYIDGDIVDIDISFDPAHNDISSSRTITITSLEERTARARLDGRDGEVMVYIPEFYIKSWDSNNKKSVRISSFKIDDTWEHLPATFVSAYKVTMLNEVPEDMPYLSTLPVNTLVSIANTNEYCIGGLARTGEDSKDYGKCRIGLSLSTYRERARLGNKEVMSYNLYKNIIYWLCIIEYATFDIQKPFTRSLTDEGFHKGGLGSNLTDFSAADVDNYKNIVIPTNGYLAGYGNTTACRLIDLETQTGETTAKVVSYRGIEDPFDYTFLMVDGVDVSSSPNVEGLIIRKITNPEEYDSNDNVGLIIGTMSRFSEPCIKEWFLGDAADIIPSEYAQNVTTYKCDAQFVTTTIGKLALGFGGIYTPICASRGLGALAVIPANGTTNLAIAVRTACLAE